VGGVSWVLCGSNAANVFRNTYATKDSFKVHVEAAPVTLVKQVKEQMKGNPMFNLQEAIAGFKTKHFKDGKVPAVTKELTADLLQIQREAVENSVDTADMDALSDEIFGEAKVETPPAKKPNDQKVTEDVVNKTKRELEATQNLAVHLQAQVKELEDYKAKTTREIAAYEKVAVALYEQVEAIAVEAEASKSSEAKPNSTGPHTAKNPLVHAINLHILNIGKAARGGLPI
jgi:hypothetical protein